MIREDRKLLAEMARVNCDVTPLAMRIMGDGVTAEEQRVMAERLIDLGQRLRERADAARVVEGHVVADQDGNHSTVQRREP